MPIINYGSLKIVNTTTSGSQYQATAAGLATGKILVTWYDDGLKAIRAQYFDAHGNRSGNEFSLSTVSSQLPRVSAKSDGGFLLAYIKIDATKNLAAFESYNADGSRLSGSTTITGTTSLFFAVSKEFGSSRIFAFSNGENSGDIQEGINLFTANSSTAGLQTCPDLAVLSASTFAVSWWDDAAKEIKFRIFDHSRGDLPQTGEITAGLVGTATQGQSFGYRGQAIASLAGGGFVVAWQSSGVSAADTSGLGIQAAIYTSSGVLVKATFQINTTTASSQLYPAIVGTLDGGFAVAWSDYSGSLGRTVLRTFDAVGNATSAEYLVDGAGHQDYQPQLTLLADGRIAVTWEADNSVPQDISGYHVEMQIVDPRSSAVYLTSVAAGSDLV
ncbi:MAG: hypothetical protein K2P80_07285, partial [Beijerinckiaceae bacterium]|nr:hypothetical protein [Beijerinckiaceae bacterium]